MENYKPVTPKSRRGRLQEVVFYEKFQLQGFDWENFVVLDLWTLMEGGHLQKVVADLSGRFNCIKISGSIVGRLQE